MLKLIADSGFVRCILFPSTMELPQSALDLIHGIVDTVDVAPGPTSNAKTDQKTGVEKGKSDVVFIEDDRQTLVQDNSQLRKRVVSLSKALRTLSKIASRKHPGPADRGDLAHLEALLVSLSAENPPQICHQCEGKRRNALISGDSSDEQKDSKPEELPDACPTKRKRIFGSTITNTQTMPLLIG